MNINWVSWSLIGAVLSAVWSLSMKKGISSIMPLDFANWYGVVSMIGMIIYNIAKRIGYQYSTLSLLIGFFQAVTSITITKSIRESPNPGSSMAVFRAQSVLTTILAVIFFGSKISIGKVIATIVVVIGVYISSSSSSTKKKPLGFHNPRRESFTDKNKVSPSSEESDSKHSSWFLFAIFAALAITGKDLLTKFCLGGNQHLKIENVILNSLIGQSIFLMAYEWYKEGTFSLQDLNGDKKVNLKDIGITVWTGIVFLIYVIAVDYSVKTAPNAGYAKSIDTLGVIITAIASHYLFGSSLTPKMMGGIALIIGGILYIAFGT